MIEIINVAYSEVLNIKLILDAPAIYNLILSYDKAL
jgi:hypothetical protein